MTVTVSRADFTNYCLRRLGAPVIEINVDNDQVQDRIDDALQFWADYHYDGLQKLYYLTEQDCANMYINLDPSVTVDSQNNHIDIMGVTRIFPISDSQATINMFDLRYQLRLNELYDFTSASYINYTLTQQHLRSLEIMFTGEVPIRFNKHMHRLFIDWAWGQSEAPAGTVVVAECYALVSPETYPTVWNDRWLKRYATAQIKKQWGENMKKYKDIPLLGGIKMDGQTIFNEAVEEITTLEHEMINDYSGPLEIFMN